MNTFGNSSRWTNPQVLRSLDAGRRLAWRRSSTRFGYCGVRRGLGPGGDALFKLLQPFAAFLRALNQLFDIGHEFLSLKPFPNFSDKWMHLGEYQKHFAAETEFHKEVFVQCSIHNKGSCHSPIASDLA